MNKNLRKKKKGFTLIELIVVIAILGILAGIAVPRFGASRTDAANVAHNANIRTIQSAAMMYLAEHGTTDLPLADAKDAVLDYLQGWPEIPNGAETDPADAAAYTIAIDVDGAVTITPPVIDLN